MKDCENCRKQPTCQRYVVKSGEYVLNPNRNPPRIPISIEPIFLQKSTAEIAADCRHFEALARYRFKCTCGKVWVKSWEPGDKEFAAFD